LFERLQEISEANLLKIHGGDGTICATCFERDTGSRLHLSAGELEE
jgi:hypothetical protein